MTCFAWCGASLEGMAATARFCGRKCRQSAFRVRQRRELVGTAPGEPGRFAYADPPYPGWAHKLYRDEDSYAGEVDHVALVQQLVAGGYTGWALSTSSKTLREVLPLCPAGVRVAAWVKPIGVSTRTYGMHSAWEPVIVAGGRRRRPGRRDWLAAQPAKRGGTLPGRKPIAFCVWLFELLGMEPGDTLDDLFPGTGVVSRAWAELSAPQAASLLQ